MSQCANKHDDYVEGRGRKCRREPVSIQVLNLQIHRNDIMAREDCKRFPVSSSHARDSFFFFFFIFTILKQPGEFSRSDYVEFLPFLSKIFIFLRRLDGKRRLYNRGSLQFYWKIDGGEIARKRKFGRSKQLLQISVLSGWLWKFKPVLERRPCFRVVKSKVFARKTYLLLLRC